MTRQGSFKPYQLSFLVGGDKSNNENYFKIAQERINSTEPTPNGFEKTKVGGQKKKNKR